MMIIKFERKIGKYVIYVPIRRQFTPGLSSKLHQGCEVSRVIAFHKTKKTHTLPIYKIKYG